MEAQSSTSHILLAITQHHLKLILKRKKNKKRLWIVWIEHTTFRWNEVLHFSLYSQISISGNMLSNDKLTTHSQLGQIHLF